MKVHITSFIHLIPFCFKQDPKKMKNNQKGLQSFFIHLIDLASHTKKGIQHSTKDNKYL